MRKTLITGATGGLGSGVVHFLSQNTTQNLIVLVRDSNTEAAKKWIDKGIEVRTGDYNDKASLIEAFKGIDNLYFVSGSDIGSRVQQHSNVVKASVEANVKHIVYTSAGRKNETENAPLYQVMRAHIDTENRIKAAGINYTILQHNLYAEVIPMFIGEKQQLLNSGMVYLPTGEGKTAFVPKMEFAEAGAKILSSVDKHINKTYSFNGSEAVTFKDVAAALSNTLGQTINFHSPTISEFEETMKSVGLPDEIIGMTIGFCLGISEGEFENNDKDIEMILGRKTQSVASFLQQVYG